VKRFCGIRIFFVFSFFIFGYCAALAIDKTVPVDKSLDKAISGNSLVDKAPPIEAPINKIVPDEKLVDKSADKIVERILVDKIVAKVNGGCILESDLRNVHIGFESKKYTLDDAIAQELYFQEAVKKKMIPTVTDVERQIASFKESQNLKKATEKEVEEVLLKYGFTLKRYKADLARYMAINSIISVEIKNRIFVTTQEIEEEFKKNLEWEDEQYILKTCIVSFDKAKNEKEVLALNAKDFDWIQTDWVTKEDISDEMAFVFDMKKGELSKPVKTANGFQIVELLDKKDRKVKSLDQVAVEIRKKLREAKMEKAEKDLLEELKSRANIEYFN